MPKPPASKLPAKLGFKVPGLRVRVYRFEGLRVLGFRTSGLGLKGEGFGGLRLKRLGSSDQGVIGVGFRVSPGNPRERTTRIFDL